MAFDDLLAGSLGDPEDSGFVAPQLVTDRLARKSLAPAPVPMPKPRPTTAPRASFGLDDEIVGESAPAPEPRKARASFGADDEIVGTPLPQPRPKEAPVEVPASFDPFGISKGPNARADLAPPVDLKVNAPTEAPAPDLETALAGPPQATTPPSDQPNAFMRGFVTGMLEQNPEMTAEAMEGLGHLSPTFKDTLHSGSKYLRDVMGAPEAYKAKSKSMWEIGGIDDALSWAGETVGQGLASTMPSVVTGLGGAAMGGRLAGRPGAVGGALLGAAGPSAALNYGEVYKALKDEGVAPETAAEYALYATGPMVLLDTVSIGPIVTRLGGIQAAKRELARGLARRIAAESAKGVGREGVTEMAQEMVKDATVSLAADKPFWTVEHAKGWAESGAAGGLTGGALGAPAGIRGDRVAAPQPVAQPQPQVAPDADISRQIPENVPAQSPTAAPAGAPQAPAAPAETAPAPDGRIPAEISAQPAIPAQMPPTDAAREAVAQSPTPTAAEQPPGVPQAAPQQPGEDAVLREYGYTDEQIGAMSPEQRAAEYQDATAAGVEPPQDFPETAAGTPQNQDEVLPKPTQAFGADDHTVGTRRAPVEIKSSGDVALAGAAASQDHTPPQGEANNAQRGHARWQGFGTTIEAPAGGVRRGVAADGTTWEQRFPEGVAYGYVKGVKGADGDHIDVFWGPNVESAREAYVLNELDRDTGKYKQTKSFVGFDTEDQARTAYLGTSGKTEKMIGGIAAIPVEDLKTWWREGNHKKPFPMPKVQKIAPKPRRPSGAPMSLLEFIASRGGLKPDPGGELRTLGLTGKSRIVVPGLGFRSLIRKDGMGLDRMREAAVEAGYIEDVGFNRRDVQATSTTNDLLRLLADELGGRRSYPRGTEGMVADAEAPAAREAAEDQLAGYRQEIAEALAEVGESLDSFREEDIALAARLVATTDMEPTAALEAAVMRNAVDGGLDSAAAIEEDYGRGASDAVQADTAPQPLPEGERPAAEAELPGAGEAGAAFGQDDEIVRPAQAEAEPVTNAVAIRDTTTGRVWARREALHADLLEDAADEVGISPDAMAERAESGFTNNDGKFSAVGRFNPELLAGAEPEGRGEEEFTTEKGAEGKPQLVLPGAEKISQAEQAQRGAEKPLKPKVAQKPADEGLFGERGQTDLVEQAQKPVEGLVERIPGPEADGTEVLIVRNSDGKRLNVVLRDIDADETVGVTIVATVEKARVRAREMLKLPPPQETKQESESQAPETGPSVSQGLPEGFKITERTRQMKGGGTEIKFALYRGNTYFGVFDTREEAVAAATPAKDPEARRKQLIERKAPLNDAETDELRRLNREHQLEQKRRKGRAASSDWTEIGKNAVGQTLYEDQRGVRSYIENGVRRVEPVPIRPTRAGVVAEPKAHEGEWRLASEIPPTEAGGEIDEDVNAALDAVLGPAAEPPTPRPRQPGELRTKMAGSVRVPTERTKAELAASAAKGVGRGTAKSIQALGELFGGKAKLSSGLTFDQDTYAKAKPLFIEAAAEFQGAWKDVADLARKLVDELQKAGFGVDVLRNMRPYLARFIQDVKTGVIDLAGEVERTNIKDREPSDERRGSQSTRPGPLDQTPSEQGEGAAGERPARGRTDRSGEPGAGGDRPSEEQGLPGARGPRGGAPAVHPPETAAGGRAGERAGPRAPGAGGRVSAKPAGPDRRGRRGAEPGAPGSVAPHEAPNLPAVNFRITDEVDLGKGSESVKFADNLAAIETLKAIESENRRATADEQRKLARYVGWGGLANAFRQPDTKELKPDWKERGERLEALLSPEELRSARASTPFAHYTSKTVIDAMWTAAKRLGFKGGITIETSAGVGNFLGLVPEDIAGNTHFIAVERDSISARIAKLLYPQSTVLESPFEQVPIPDNEAALVIGNPPFSSVSLNFRNKPEFARMSMHNQFILAGLDALRPNGIQIVVVSRYLMDAQDSDARLKMAERADLLAAVRLPDVAFKENARTEVVTDILVFQKLDEAGRKRREGAIEASQARPLQNHELERQRQALAAEVPEWVGTEKVKDPLGGEDMVVNAYFAKRSAKVMGRLERSGTMRAEGEINVKLPENADLGRMIDGALSGLKPSLDHTKDVAAETRDRFARLSESLGFALSGAEPGHLEIGADGTMTQIIEREAPSGTEVTKRTITAESPWSRQLLLDQQGRWYALEPVTQAEFLDITERADLVRKIAEATGTQEREQYEAALKTLPSRIAQARQTGALAKEGRRNIFKRKYFEGNNVPGAMRLGKERFARLTDLVKLRDLLKRQLTLEAEDAPTATMEANRKKLRDLYESYTKANGYLNDQRNSALVYDMPDGALVMALETGYRKPVTIAKAKRTGGRPAPSSAMPAPILTQRVVPKYERAARADSAADALSITLSELGRVDMERIAKLLGKTEAEAEAVLQEGDKPLVFFDPETKTWEPASAYLSGQVARKLNAAREAGLEKNTKALEAVQPEKWGSENVDVLPGANWVPKEDYAEFARHLLGGDPRIDYSPLTNAWELLILHEDQEKAQRWSTPDMPADAILRGMLNSRVPKVWEEDSDGHRYVNKEASALVELRAREIESEFTDWVFRDSDRRRRLTDIYNEKFNTRVTRQHDGSHLTLPGKVPDAVIRMRRHQLNAIWRGIYERFVLYDHVVGAGKTFTAIARVMERRRMGLSRKPMIVVPNHLVDQWTQDVYRLYPGARVLAAASGKFDRQNRRRLFAQIATGDYDVIIVPHSSFLFINIDPATERRFLDEELRIAQEALAEAEDAAAQEGGRPHKSFTVKEAERVVSRILNRMDALKSASKKDKLVTFEQMGIDDLTIDESHEFKNLFYASNLQNVRGMGTRSGSRKAFDLYTKLRVLRESPTGSIVFMSGTPISNSAVEMYSIMRYLAANELKGLGIEHFDAWRLQYVSATTAWEPTEAGGIKEVTRLGRTWSNMRALMELYLSFTDAVSQQDIDKAYAADNAGARFPVPKVRGGERQSVVVPPTAAQARILEQTIHDFNALPFIQDPDERNIERLRLMDRARKVSLDARLVEPGLESDEKGGKLDVIADNVARIWRTTEKDAGTQLVFLDRGVKAGKTDDKLVKEYDELVVRRDKALAENNEAAYRELTDKLDAYDPNEIAEVRRALQGGWNAYDQLKQNLIRRGIPANEIRFVQEANTDAEKKALFDLVNDGEVRVLIGSTPRMGAGTNVQERLVALHHGDVTWKPSDIEQREGRIIRQGNSLFERYSEDFEVEILAYVTERTVDAKMWDLNATKLRMINGIRQYDGEFRMEFEDEDAVGMAEIAALASGDPLLLERVKLETELGKLELLRSAHMRRRHALEDKRDEYQRILRDYPKLIEKSRAAAAEMRAAFAEVQRAVGARKATVEGATYDLMIDAEKAVAAEVERQKAGDEHARYSVNINGAQLTNKAAIEDALRSAFGDVSPFEAIIEGGTITRRAQLRDAIEAKLIPMLRDMEKRTSQQVKLGTMLGGDLIISVEKKDKFATVVLAVVKDGRTLAAAEKTDEFAGTALTSPQAVLALIDRLIADAESVVGDRGQWLAAQIAEAEKLLPVVQEQLKEPFKGAAELEEKRGRLAEVISTLDAATKAAEERTKAAKAEEARKKGGKAEEPDEAIASLARQSPDLRGPDYLTPTARERYRDLERMLTDLVRRVAGPNLQVRFVWGDRIRVQAPKRAWGKYAERETVVDAIYVPADRIITIALGAPDVGLRALHEAFHDIEGWLLTPREREMMIRETDRLRAVVRDHFGFTQEEVDTMAGTEIRAQAFEVYAAMRERRQNMRGILPAMHRAFERIYQFLRAVRNLLSGYGFHTAEDVFRKAWAGEMAARPAREGPTAGPFAFQGMAALRPRPTVRLTKSAQAKRKEIVTALRDAIRQVAGENAARRAQFRDVIGAEAGAAWVAERRNAEFRVFGQYKDAFDLIEIALADNPDALVTALHEGWHSIESVLGEDEVGLLERETDRLREYILRNNKDWNPETIRSIHRTEVWAEAAAISAAKKMRGERVDAPIALRRIFDKIVRLIERIRSALHGLGFQTADDVFERFAGGELAARREMMLDLGKGPRTGFMASERLRAAYDELAGDRQQIAVLNGVEIKFPDDDHLALFDLGRKLELRERTGGQAEAERLLARFKGHMITDPEYGDRLRNVPDLRRAARDYYRQIREEAERGEPLEAHDIIEPDSREFWYRRAIEELEAKYPQPAPRTYQDRSGLPARQQVRRVRPRSGSLPVPQITMPPETVRDALNDPNLSRSERLSAAIDAALLTPSRALWDRIIDLSRLQRAAELASGQAVPENLDTYLAATLYPGRVGERLVDASRELFEPIYDEMKAQRITRDELHEYLYARHAIERNAQIRTIDQNNDAGSGMTDAEAQQILDAARERQAAFDAIAALVDRVVAHNRGLMEREGLEHAETLMQWAQAYPHYVPLKGAEAAESEQTGPERGQGFMVRRPESRRALGRFSRAGDILTNLLDQTQRTIIRAEKNRVGKTFLRFAQRNPSPLYRFGLAETRRQPNPVTGLVETVWVTTSADADNVFAAKVAGQTYYIRIEHEGLLTALKNIGMDRLNPLFRMIAAFTRNYSALQTARNPEFVVTNLARDLLEAGFNLTAEQRKGFKRAYLKNLANGRALLAAVLGESGNNRFSRLYNEWRLAGGKISMYGHKDIETLRKDIERELARRTESMAKKMAMQPLRLINPVSGHVVKLFEAMSDVTESAVRLAVYAAARDIGLTQAQAAKAARVMTVDFNAHGKYGPTMKALYAFSNPAIQGTVVLMRRLRASRKFRAYAGALASLGFGVTLWNLWMSGGGDDDDERSRYERKPYWERESNFVIYLPGGGKIEAPFKFPMAFAIRPFFMAGENAAMWLFGKKTTGLEAIGNWLGTTAKNFNPLGAEGPIWSTFFWIQTFVPTIGEPLVQLGLNKNWLGRPIHPEEGPWAKGTPRSEQSKMTTDPSFMDLAAWLNRTTGGGPFKKGAVDLYPDDLEYAWNFALGGMGKFIANSQAFVRNRIDGIDTPVEKIPFVRRFVSLDNTLGAARAEYYEKSHEAGEAAATLHKAMAAERAGNDVEAAGETIRDLGPKLGLVPSLTPSGDQRMRKGAPVYRIEAESIYRESNRQLQTLRLEERRIRNDPSMSREKRGLMLEANHQEQRRVMRGANRSYRSLQPSP